jgi:hypothetical protein
MTTVITPPCFPLYKVRSNIQTSQKTDKTDNGPGITLRAVWIVNITLVLQSKAIPVGGRQVLIRLWDVEQPTLSAQSAHR